MSAAGDEDEDEAAMNDAEKLRQKIMREYQKGKEREE